MSTFGRPLGLSGLRRRCVRGHSSRPRSRRDGGQAGSGCGGCGSPPRTSLGGERPGLKASLRRCAALTPYAWVPNSVDFAHRSRSAVLSGQKTHFWIDVQFPCSSERRLSANVPLVVAKRLNAGCSTFREPLVTCNRRRFNLSRWLQHPLSRNCAHCGPPSARSSLVIFDQRGPDDPLRISAEDRLGEAERVRAGAALGASPGAVSRLAALAGRPGGAAAPG